jgi:hypothetical protein
VFLVGGRESKFGSSYLVRSNFENVSGLNEGADVRVGGIRKGTVQSIRLPKKPDGRVVVTMNLSRDTQSIVKQDSIASIQSEGLLGDKYVDVAFGSLDAAELKGGETIESAAVRYFGSVPEGQSDYGYESSGTRQHPGGSRQYQPDYRQDEYGKGNHRQTAQRFWPTSTRSGTRRANQNLKTSPRRMRG